MACLFISFLFRNEILNFKKKLEGNKISFATSVKVQSGINLPPPILHPKPSHPTHGILKKIKPVAVISQSSNSSKTETSFQNAPKVLKKTFQAIKHPQKKSEQEHSTTTYSEPIKDLKRATDRPQSSWESQIQWLEDNTKNTSLDDGAVSSSEQSDSKSKKSNNVCYDLFLCIKRSIFHIIS